MDDRAWLARAIELNCDALLRIAAQLVAVLRLPGGGMKDSLPAAIYFRVLRILRPAESAVRRLIVLEAIGLDDEPGIPRKPPDNGTTRAKTQSGSRSKPKADPAFQLFDPFKPLPDNPWITEGDKHEDVSDALPGSADFRPDEPRDAKSLGRRVRALIDALDDLPAQAKRLARWRLTRRRPRRLSSLRPGFPPGYRRGRPIHEVDSVLRECQGLVGWANKPPGQR
ncbi:hypothetical protein [Oricola indica]|uniref:hypothetical protein n=1 Tax=Oricola indica TaxID=2872591 RepID=UPI003CCBC654